MGASSSKNEELRRSRNKSLLPLLVLSLTKIEDFKAYFEKYSELYQNKNELIQVFIDLIKNEKSVDDIVNKNIKLLMKANNPLVVKKFYKSKLQELHKYLEEINKNISNPPSKSIIKKLFFGKKKKVLTCCACKETKRIVKSNIIYLSFDLANISDNFNVSEKISRTINYEKKKHCDKKKFEADCNITCNYDLPNIILIILYNCKQKTDINFALSKKTFDNQYDLICFITLSGEMVFKEGNDQWFLYTNKDKKNKQIEMNQDEIKKYNPIVFFYQKIEKKIILHEAIIEYVKLQNEIDTMGKNHVKQLYLAQMEFFDNILNLIGINQNNLLIDQDQVNMNAINNLEKKIEEKKNELLNMEPIEIFDDKSCKKKNFAFVNEKILNKLGIEKVKYVKKQITLNKTDNNKFVITFENGVSLGISKQGKIIKILSINNNFHINNFANIKIFYDILSNIFEQQKKISKSIEENKIDENKLENYYIINAKWFNKMIKIFESDEIYDDDNYKIESFDNITNIINLNENDLKIKNDFFLKRKQILMDENLFKVEYEEKSGIKYPDKFVLIKENTLNELLNKLQITFKNIHMNIYQTFNGEHFLFIKDNSEKNKYNIQINEILILIKL